MMTNGVQSAGLDDYVNEVGVFFPQSVWFSQRQEHALCDNPAALAVD